MSHHDYSLLLDANIVIEAHRLRLWDDLIQHCDLYLADAVVKEADFYFTDNNQWRDIDLRHVIKRGYVKTVSADRDEMADFKRRFGDLYYEDLEPGEVESLVFLLNQSRPHRWRICSADRIVFRALGAMHRGELGISFQEVLEDIGHGRRLKRWFTRRWREQTTRQGFREAMMGLTK